MSFLKLSAAALICVLAVPASAAVVTNGDFEDTSSSNPEKGLVNDQLLNSLNVGGGATWDVYTSIPGWTTAAGAGIEVQTNRTLSSIDAHSGSHYIELDSHPRSTSNSAMQQKLTLAAGVYDLTFFYSPRTSDVNTNGISYSVVNKANNNILLGAVSGPSATHGTKVGVWTEVTSRFTVGVDDSPLLLKFAATGTQNTLGGLIDSVSISAVPVPAGLPLLMSAMAGLAWMRRRKASA